MEKIIAYRASDGTKFYDETECRDYERRLKLEALIIQASANRPEFAKLDTELLIDFMLIKGQAIGEIVGDPIEATELFRDRYPPKSVKPRFASGGPFNTPPEARTIVGERPSETIVHRHTGISDPDIPKRPGGPVIVEPMTAEEDAEIEAALAEQLAEELDGKK